MWSRTSPSLLEIKNIRLHSKLSKHLFSDTEENNCASYCMILISIILGAGQHLNNITILSGFGYWRKLGVFQYLRFIRPWEMFVAQRQLSKKCSFQARILNFRHTQHAGPKSGRITSDQLIHSFDLSSPWNLGRPIVAADCGSRGQRRSLWPVNTC